MSYILDALKKNQAEQADAGVSLQPHRRGTPPWLALGLVAVLVINIGLVGWIFWERRDPDPPVNANEPAASAAAQENDSPSAAAQSPQVSQETLTGENPIEPATPDAVPVPQQPPSPPPARVPSVALGDLPAQEQILYNGFNYSTHIYTDDPSLCAIVVDGQRLTAGDTFKGLKVIAITEAGVLFEETRRGQRRRVEVSVLEQWERE